MFVETVIECAQGEINGQSIDILARYLGTEIPFVQLPQYLQEDIAELEDLIKAGDRELFEDILANTVSRKIRGKINASNAWVDKMNHLMSGMNTSSGLKLSLRWRSKTAESEDQGGREDAPRLISLDEAFAGVDNRNIRDMFRLMTEFEFDFIINSQVLWGDCDTLDALAIYQLQRPQNAKFVTIMPYLWNGHAKEFLENEQMVEKRSEEIGSL